MARSFFYKRYPHIFRFFFWAAAAVSGFISIVVFVLAISLSSGPVSLDFAKSYLEEYLIENDSSYAIHMDKAELAWDADSASLVLNALGVHVQNKNIEHHSLHLPNLEFKYRLTSLFKLKLIPSEVVVLEPHIHLYQGGDGSLYLTKDQTPQLEWQFILTDQSIKSLKNMEIKNLSLDVENLHTGEKWTVPRADLKLTRDGNLINCDLSSDVRGAKVTGILTADLVKQDRLIEAVNIKLSAQLEEFEFDDLDKFWHGILAPHARKWVVENLSKAKVSKANLEVSCSVDFKDSLPKAVMDTIGGEIHFTGMEVRYFDEMPPVTNVSGIAQYNNKEFDIKVLGGQLKDVLVDSGRVHIVDFDKPDQSIKIDIDVKGPIHTALNVLEEKPLNIIAKLGIKLKKIDGIAQGRIHFDFPLETTLTLDQINFSAKTVVKDVAIHGLNKGQFDLEVDRSKLTVSGNALYQGIPIAAVWQQKFDDNPKDWKVRYDVSAELTPEHMIQLGYGGYSLKPILLKAQLTEHDSSSGQLLAEIDFKSFVLPGFTSEEPGKAHVEAVVKNGELQQIYKINVASKDISMNSNVVYDPATQSIKSVSCPQLRMGKTHVSFKFTEDVKRHYHVDVTGESLDFEGILDYLKNRPSTEGKVTPIHFSCNVDHAWFYKGKKSLSAMKLAGYHNDESLQTLSLSGQITDLHKNHLGDMQLNQTLQGDEKKLHFTSSNAGEALDLLGLASSVRQGGIDLQLTKKPQTKWEGKLKIKNFHVRNAPVVTQLLAIISPFGIIDAVAGTPIAFSKFSTKIVYDEGRIWLTQGRAVGASIGFTVAGLIDRSQNTLDVRGTILPYNAINVFLLKIPVVSSLLGGKGGGVLGFNYGLNGSIDEPHSHVNPLSVLTPGILREVFSNAPKSDDE